MPAPRLFNNNLKECIFCGKLLPESYESPACPGCKDLQLFSLVKDYIRENDVNEYQVAAQFDIPLRLVKQWIKEGRIEYKENDPKHTIINAHCQNCGDPVLFGALCPKCLKLVNRQLKGYGTSESLDESRMRFLNELE